MESKEACFKCNQLTSTTLVEIFPPWNNSDHNHNSMMVCSTCLVGAVIPVLRPTTGKWEFASVERALSPVQDKSLTGANNYKTTGGSSNPGTTHYVRFMDSKCEWVLVETSAYDQYIHFHQKNNNSWPLVFIDQQNGTMASFGYEDDATMEDPSVDYDHESISRQLEKSFDAMDDDYGMDQRPTNPGRAHHKSLTGVPLPAHPKYKSSASGTTIMSLSPSMSPEMINRTRSNDESPFTTPTKMYTRNRDGGSSTASPKYSQKLWTPEEDRILLHAVSKQSKSNLKWSLVAKAVPGRSGKQCRERYLNHLTPNIKLKNWSPVEDATIFRLYWTDGSKWSMMSKLIRGRTDNGIKNRYHHLKRRLERQVYATPTSRQVEIIIMYLQQSVLMRDCEPWMLKYVATQGLRPMKKVELNNETKSYLRIGRNELCARCGLFVPSLQTGHLVCKTTGWCEVCARVSPCLSGDLLRAIDNARQMITVD